MKYFESLTETAREEIFEYMRGIDTEAQRLEKEHYRLAPRHGEIAVGSAHFDPWVKSYAIQSYLTGLRNGLDPNASAEFAKEECEEAVKIHNSKRSDINWARDLGTAEPTIDRLYRQTPKITE